MALPSTPLLDDFCRPAQSPLSWLGKWSPIDTGVYSSTMQINQIAGLPQYAATFSAAGGGASSYWTNSAGLTNPEVWMTFRQAVNPAVLGLHACLSNVGGASAFSGYVANFKYAVQATIVRYDAGSPTTLATGGGPTQIFYNPDDRVVFRVNQGVLAMYYIPASTGKPYPMIYAVDSTYTSGYIGFSMSGVNGSGGFTASNFGGGAIDSLVPAAHRSGGWGSA